MTAPGRIQLRRTKGWRKPEGAVSVARPTRWGNPFPAERATAVGLIAAAEGATARFRGWITAPEQADLLASARRELAGKVLACWCPLDQPCHADVWLELVNAPVAATVEVAETRKTVVDVGDPEAPAPEPEPDGPEAPATLGLVFVTKWDANGRAGHGILTAGLKDEAPVFSSHVNALSDVTQSRVADKVAAALVRAHPELDNDAGRAWTERHVLGELTRIAASEAHRATAEPERVEQREREDAYRKHLADLLATRDAESAEALKDTPADVVEEARAALLDERLFANMLDDVAACGVVGEQELAATIYLIGTSRILADPLAGIVQGTSSSGKSYTVAKVAELFPPEAKWHATQLTPQTLYHVAEHELMHRWVIAGERSRLKESDEKAEATRALRELLSEKVLVKPMPTKTEGGKIVTKKLVVRGPIAHTETTTLTEIFEEDLNRALPLASDESKEQTHTIMRSAGNRAALPGDLRAALDARVARIVARHHAMQRHLVRVTVTIPFAARIAEAMIAVATTPQARRAINQTFALIRAVACFYQWQRADGEPAPGQTIEATIEDYLCARALLIGPLARAVSDALPDNVLRFGQRLAAEWGIDDPPGPTNPNGTHAKTFTREDAAQKDPIVRTAKSAGRYLGTLKRAGVVEVAEENRGAKAMRWRVVGEPQDLAAQWLPDREQLQGPNPED